MGFEYKIKAHPTMYNGVQYRSRLEARWAAFFDLIGWQHEYEPIDLPGWSPDFLLHGKTDKVFVEVKPVNEFPVDVANQIDLANPYVYEEYFEEFEGRTIPLRKHVSECHEVLIVGISPFVHGDYRHPFVGWLRDSMGCWDGSPFVDHCGLGFCHESQSFACRMTNGYSGGDWGHSKSISDQVTAKWKQAGNIVQWIARGIR